MSSIEMSPSFSLKCISNVLGYSAVTNYQPNGNPAKAPLFGTSSSSTPGNMHSRLNIMKGVKPVDANTLINTVKLLDSLVVFSSDQNLIHWMDSVVNQNPANMVTPYVNAVETGLATWFWLVVTDVTDPTVVLQQMIGTVGINGSGADLEISNVNIVAGEPYRILNLRLQFPISWTV